MTTFDNRDKAFENKYAHDKELMFKATARRNKSLGLWAAGLLGKSGDSAEEYAKEVVMADFDEPGDEDVLKKVLADLTAASIAMTHDELRLKMDEMLKDTIEELKR